MNLTPRQRELLDALLRGENDKEIAFRLGLSRESIAQYFGKLMARLGVHNRAALVVWAYETGYKVPGK